MKFDLLTGSPAWADNAELARRVEAAVFSGMLYTDTSQVPWMQISHASPAAPSLTFTDRKSTRLNSSHRS